MWPFQRHTHHWTLDGKTFGYVRCLDGFGYFVDGTTFVYRCASCGCFKRIFSPGREIALEPLAMRQAREIAGS